MRTRLLAGIFAMVAAIGFISSAEAGISGTGLDYTFNFDGTCQDCSLQADYTYGLGPASAVLNLTNYVLGDPLLLENVSAFTYWSDKLGILTADSFWSVGGSITSASPAVESVSLGFTSASMHYDFETYLNGDWAMLVGPAPGADIGSTHTWSASQPDQVPEPATLALLGAALGMMGVRRKHRK
jgi:PEP-CTERM motif